MQSSCQLPRKGSVNSGKALHLHNREKKVKQRTVAVSEQRPAKQLAAS